MGMLIHLHSQATTTPKVRAAIQASDEVGTVLAERFGVTPQTIYKWRKRDTVEDRSHTPHRLQTTLTPAQEVVAVALRKALLISLDDLLAVVREFLNPHVSRSGLDRCLRRHGVGNLRDLKVKSARPKHSGFKAYEPGYIHIDVKYLPQMADETSRRYLFVAIDRATRWVFIRIFKAKTAANARRFLRDLERACPMRIRTILTDNAKEFTDRLFGLRKRAPTGEHEFDKLCADLDIDQRLTPPKSPQTNGMVERFNGRIEEVLQSHHFRSGEELEATLHRYVWLYNQQLPQSALGSRSPLQAMKDWYTIKPKLFKKRPYYLPGCDKFGSQCIVVSIDYRKEPDGRYVVYSESGTKRTPYDPVDYAKIIESKGAGEIILTSIDNEGMMSGYDLSIAKEVCNNASIQVILSGGAGSAKDMIAAIDAGASAVAAGSIFHFTEQTPMMMKKALAEQGYPVRN